MCFKVICVTEIKKILPLRSNTGPSNFIMLENLSSPIKQQFICNVLEYINNSFSQNKA